MNYPSAWLFHKIKHTLPPQQPNWIMPSYSNQCSYPGTQTCSQPAHAQPRICGQIGSLLLQSFRSRRLPASCCSQIYTRIVPSTQINKPSIPHHKCVNHIQKLKFRKSKLPKCIFSCSKPHQSKAAPALSHFSTKPPQHISTTISTASRP